MTQRLLLLLSLLSVSTVLFASHEAGSSIRYKALGNNRYYVEASAVRDCFGIQNSQYTVQVRATCSTTSGWTGLTLTHIPFIVNQSPYGGPYAGLKYTAGGNSFVLEEISDVCDAVLDPSNMSMSTRCVTSVSNNKGYMRLEYGAIVTLTPCNFWTLGFTTGPRNVSNSNITSALKYVETKFNSILSPSNSPPTFTDYRRPMITACVNQLSEYQFGSNDIDGDSLTYKLVCTHSSATTCATYAIGFSATRPINGAILDSTTGRFRYKPAAAGKRIVTVQISEYDRCNGNWKASTLRDITIDVYTCGNTIPGYKRGIDQLSGSDVSQLDSFRIQVKAGTSFSFEDTIFDPNSIDTIILLSDYNSLLPGSQLTINQISKNRLHYKFSWSVPVWAKGTYVLPITLSDDRCPMPGKNRLAFHFEVKPAFSISSAGSKDTILLFKGDTASIGSNGVGLINWNSVSGSALIWSGSQQNTWGDTTAADTNTSIRFKPTVSTLLYATGANGQGCSSNNLGSDTIFIKVIPPFGIRTTGDTLVCSNVDSIPLYVIADSNFSYTYKWETVGGKISNKTSSTPWVSAVNGAIYFVTVTSQHGGKRKEQVKIRTVADINNLEIKSISNELCVGGSLNLWADFKQQAKMCSAAEKDLNPVGRLSHHKVDTFFGALSNVMLPNPFTTQFNSTKQQYLYRASELKRNGIAAGKIQELAFYVDSNASGLPQAFAGIRVQLKCTNDTVLWSYATGLTEVLSPKISAQLITPGWNTLTFDSAYVWDGTSNLIVQFCHDRGITTTNMNIITAMQKVNYQASLSYGGVNACSSTFLSLGKGDLIPLVRFMWRPLRDTADFRYTWSPGSSLNSMSASQVIASPTSATTYQVVISDSQNVCTDTIYKSLTLVNPKLDAGNDTTLCSNSEIILVPTLTPSIPGAYKWFPPAAFQNPNQKNVRAKVDSSMNLIVNYKNTIGCNLFDTIRITSTPTPDPGFSGTGPFCETEMNNALIANTPGGTFTGLGVSGTNFDATEPSVKPGLTAPKKVIIDYRVFQNGCWADTSIEVEVYPQFDTLFTGVKVLCELDPAEPLQTRHTGGNWSGTGVLADHFDPVAVGVGTHTIFLDSIGFCGNSASYQMEVLKAPDHDFPSIMYACSRKPALLEAGNPGGNYLWSTGDTTQNITVSQSGVYWVQINVGKTCELRDSTEVKYTALCVGIDELEMNNSSIQVYPNPASSEINVKSTKNVINRIELLTFAGQLVYVEKVNQASHTKINISSLAQGYYVLKVFGNFRPETYRIFIIE